MGRQPWVVYGLMKTAQAISPTVGAGDVVATLAGFSVLYSVLGVVDVVLMSRAARSSLGESEDEGSGSPDAGEEVVGFVY
jgi:cytochrome d ubiquinol oxidase subunit I